MDDAKDRSRIFKKNAAILRTQYPELYRIITENRADTAAITTHQTKTGLPGIEATLDHNLISLHSKIDPVREARRIADSVMDGSEQVIVLIGFGLGYHLEKMLRKNGHTRFVVIEPDTNIFAKALEVRDLRFALESDRFMLFVEPDTVPFDEIIPEAGTVKFYIHRPYALLFPEKTDKLKQAFLKFSNRTIINTATLSKFDRLWTRNTFKNCEYFFSLNGVDVLRNSLKGFAALVLAAGPSLDEDIEKIRQLQQNIFIIASDSVLRPLLRHSIIPDFVVTVDPQFINSFHVAGLPLNEGDAPILIADPAVHPSTLRNYSGITAISSSVFSPGQLIEEFSGIKGRIAAGGSVATAAFDFTRITGADPIIVAGLDLSYAKGKTHLSGSFIEDYIHSKAYRFKTAGSFYAEYIRSGKPTAVTDRNGCRVFTDKRLLLYKSWFENQSFSNDSTILNATSGGLSIPGIQDVEFKAISRFVSNGHEKKQDRKKIINAELKPPDISNAGISRFTAYLHRAKKNLQSLQGLAREACSIASRMLKNNIGIQTGDKSGASPPGVSPLGKSRFAAEYQNLTCSKLLRRLASIDAGILSFREENRIISMVLQSPIHKILGDKALENKQDALKNSITLYSAMDEASGMLIDLVSLAERKIARYVQ